VLILRAANQPSPFHGDRNENQFWRMKIILNLAIGRKFLAVTLFKAEVQRSFVLFSHRA
jgi:hypothetical protein